MFCSLNVNQEKSSLSQLLLHYHQIFILMMGICVMTSMCKYLILRGFLIFITVPQKNCIIKRIISTKHIFVVTSHFDVWDMQQGLRFQRKLLLTSDYCYIELIHFHGMIHFPKTKKKLVFCGLLYMKNLD